MLELYILFNIYNNFNVVYFQAVTPAKSSTNDTLQRICEMGEEPERRPFLERLFSFMDDKGASITAMPMVSKQPIDLFRLYIMVKERGGLLEVC